MLSKMAKVWCFKLQISSDACVSIRTIKDFMRQATNLRFKTSSGSMQTVVVARIVLGA